eukprot:2204238-Pleurochrysis_carterae.AAC.1
MRATNKACEPHADARSCLRHEGVYRAWASRAPSLCSAGSQAGAARGGGVFCNVSSGPECST